MEGAGARLKVMDGALRLLPASLDIRQQARPDVSNSEELQTHLNEI